MMDVSGVDIQLERAPVEMHHIVTPRRCRAGVTVVEQNGSETETFTTTIEGVGQLRGDWLDIVDDDHSTSRWMSFPSHRVNWVEWE